MTIAPSGECVESRVRAEAQLTTFEPVPDSSEFFVTVAILPRDRSRHAARAAGHSLEADYGSFGAVLGGLVGTVASGAVSDDAICVEVMPDIVDATRREVQRLGWECHVSPVSLPPAVGQSEWRKYMLLPSGGLVMVFRAELLKPAVLPHQSAGTKLFQIAAGCCSVRPPLFYKSARGVEL